MDRQDQTDICIQKNIQQNIKYWYTLQHGWMLKPLDKIEETVIKRWKALDSKYTKHSNRGMCEG